MQGSDPISPIFIPSVTDPQVMPLPSQPDLSALQATQRERERLVWQISQGIRQSQETEEILQIAVDQVRQLLKTDRVIVFQLQADGSGTVVTESVGDRWSAILSTQITDSCLEQGDITAYREGRVTAISDIDQATLQPCHRELLAKFEVQANLVVPLLQGEHLWGLLIAHHCEAPRQWLNEEITLLQQLAIHLSIALQQADLYRCLKAELVERQQRELELQQYADLFNHIQVGLAVATGGGETLIRMNAAFARMHGYAMDEMVGMPIIHLFPDHLIPEAIDFIKQIDSVGHGRWESFHKRKDGTIFPIQIDATSVKRPDGSLSYRIVNVHDITSRKEAEARLRQSEAALRESQIVANLGSWEYDVATQLSTWSAGLYHLHGMEPGQLELSIDNTQQLIHPEDREQFLQLLRQAIATKKTFHHDFRYLRWKDHTPRYLEIRGTPVFDDQGQLVRLVGTCIDISDRKQAELALKQNKDLLEAIFEGSTDALFLVDHQTLLTLDCNQRAVELFEAPNKQDLIGIEGHTLQKRGFTPAEIAAIAENMKDEVWIQEVEYVTRRGHVFWGNLAATTLQVGDLLVNLVRITDVTDRKQVEIALRESQNRYRTLAEAMPQMVWTADATGAVNYLNQRWYDYTGLTAAGSLGFERIKVVHPEERDRTLAQWKQAVAQGQPFEIEYRLRHHDGTYQWFISRGLPIHNEAGQITDWFGTITNIHALKEAESAIAQSERHVRRVLDSLFSFVGVMTPEGVLIEANRTALAAANLKPQDVLGKPFPETYWWSYSTEVQAQLQAAIEQARQGNVVRYDVQVRLGPEKFIIIDFAVAPLFDAQGRVEYLVPSGIDISDRKQAETELRASQAQLQRQLAEIEAIYQSAPIGLNVLDTDLRFIRINQRLAEINGLSAEAHIGRTVREVVPDLADAAEAVLSQVLETGEPILNVEISGETPAQPGVQRTWLEHFLPLKHGDRVVGISTVCAEITERKQAEAALQQSEAQLRHQAEQLVQANRIKDEFLAVLSHELRTPLNPILGWAKLLQSRTFSPEKTQQALATIERNARLQVQLIDDLLDISRIIRGKLTLNFAPIFLVEVIRAAIETVRHTAEAKSIGLDIDLDLSVGKVMGDAGRIQQIVWNLLSNAIKFTPVAGQVRIRLTQRVPVGSPRENRRAYLEVSDTGKGIHSDFVPHLFEMFRQQDSSITRQFGGLGLGLAISRQLVEAHGGSIDAISPGENQGSTFTVQLPLLAQPDDPFPAAPALSSALALQGVRVLVVEDEPDTLELIKVVLEAEGAIAIPVGSAAVALEALRQSTVDVLVSDIQMANMDGYELMQQIRTQFPYLPAIALTAYAYEADRERAFRAGYSKHLTKPIEPKALIDAIAALHFTQPPKL